MKFFPSRAAVLRNLEERLHDRLAHMPALVESAMPRQRSKAQQMAVTAAWVAAGVGVVTLGLIAGREIRTRYKFKRRTPYDYYAHSGDTQELEFGVGI